jgi:hypothetical protein
MFSSSSDTPEDMGEWKTGDGEPKPVASTTQCPKSPRGKRKHGQAMFSSSEEPEKPVTPPRKQWKTAEHERAVWKLLHEPMLTSFAEAARMAKVEQRWLQDVAMLAADLVVERQRVWFERLLLSLEEAQEKGSVRCVLFSWCPMADETPTANRTTHVGGGDSSESEHEDAGIAKIMSVRVTWSMVFAERSDDWKHTIVRGVLPCRLRPVQSQHGLVVAAVFRDLAAVPRRDLVERLFPEKHCLWATDLHASNLFAIRCLQHENPAWCFAHFRCAAHRLRTAELAALKVDAEFDSFFMHTTLHLNNPGVMQLWRTKARIFAKNHFIINLGAVPETVVQRREAILRPIRARAATGACSQALVR